VTVNVAKVWHWRIWGVSNFRCRDTKRTRTKG